MKFVIEQLAIMPNPVLARKARKLLVDLGLENWIEDTVIADGYWRGEKGIVTSGVNKALLSFSYPPVKDSPAIEFEILEYQNDRDHWMQGESMPAFSHIGMHVDYDQLRKFHEIMKENRIEIVQQVITRSHTNLDLLEAERRYHYVIFGTRHLLGFDIKFIVRISEKASLLTSLIEE